MEKLKKFFKEEEGVTALEYTVLAALIIIVIIIFFTPIRNAVSKIWSEINSAMTAATS
ncbi:MAG: Flp1 family type IVb pilin [Thermodesulfobacteriota bacterium]|jgi:pilus assembly protein Flp/PilA|nr:MAG: Flp1 family type IVb pilin [Thermodesulfobacteriota bacterium]